MKNIPTQNLLDQIAGESRGINWSDNVELSRFEAGLSTSQRHVLRYCNRTDFKDSYRKIIRKLNSDGYMTTENTNGLYGILLIPDERAIKCYVNVNTTLRSGDTLSIFVMGDEAECEAMIEWFSEQFNVMGSTISTASSVDGNGNIQYDKTFIPEGSLVQAKQSFYPWLGISLDEYYQKFMDSKEPILVMYGPKGTGKTSFLRSLIAHGNYHAYLAYNQQVVESPELLRRFYKSAKARILGYEDIDKQMSKREDGNPLMASLLNAADGVIQHVGKKLVFVTNLPSTDRIDEALMRQGRCFDIMEFKLLSPEEVVAVRKDMNLPPKDFGHTNPISLAEALAPENVRQKVNRFGRGMGFGS